jgi:GNAT superfamily N-acetyltransferase
MENNQETRRHNEEPVLVGMTKFAGLYDIRDVKPEDANFVLATFLRGLYYGDSWFSLIPKDIFMLNYKKVAEVLLKSNNTVVKIACLKEDQDVILGYSILSADYQTIHWVFVKQAWRNKGIARSLLPQYSTNITHLTDLGRKLMNKLPTAIFNPFKLGL